jgi:hypothetical protein
MASLEYKIDQATVDYVFYKNVTAEYLKTLTSPLLYLYAHQRVFILVVPKTATNIIVYLQTRSTIAQYRLEIAHLFADRVLWNVLRDFQEYLRRQGNFRRPRVATDGFRVYRHHVERVVQRFMIIHGREITITKDALFFVYLYAISTSLHDVYLSLVPSRDEVSKAFCEHPHVYLRTLLKHFVFQCVPLLFRTGTYYLTVQGVRTMRVYPRFM